MIDVIKVGMADLGVGASPTILRTVGLGSCVGVTLYDSVVCVGGLAHVMLPDSTSISQSALIDFNKGKFADTAIVDLLEKLQALGADPTRLVAKMVGGAQMFASTVISDSMKIGPRNVDAVKNQLVIHRIPLIAEDTGGSYGRTIDFCTVDGVLVVRTAFKEQRCI